MTKYEIESVNPSSVAIHSDHLPQNTLLGVDAISDQILRFHTYSKGAQPNTSFAIEDAVQAEGNFKITKNDAGFSLCTDKLSLDFNSELELIISDTNGNILCEDYTSQLESSPALSDYEIEQLELEGHTVQSNEDNYTYKITKKLYGDEAIYGLGDKTGFLNKKGYDYIMWNSDNPDPHVENPTFRAMYKTIPFFIVYRPSCVYGIFSDNTFQSYFDMGATDPECYSFSVSKGELDYYFIQGDSIKEVIQGYTKLTGRAPLPQMWTLGYQQSRWSYTSAKEVLSLAKNFRKYDIPCDAIHLDIDYMERFKVFTVDSQRFGDLKELKDQLAQMGIKLVTIIDPGVKVEEGYDVYEEGVANGYFATADGKIYHNTVWPGDSVFPDFTSKKVREWWGDQTKKLLEYGICGIWNDMNEPASFNGPLPNDVVFPGDSDPKLHEEIHNVYGHLMAKATYDGLRKNDTKRPFIITRACYSGSQKYSTVWTGDNQSIWSHLKLSIPQLLNLGMSGISLAGVDIGGFGSNTTPELLSRWIEAGCFSPLFRNHSAKMTRRQEPWTFDEKTLDIYRKYVKLHYKFIPYLYDLCYEESLTGVPVLRPLIMEFEKDENLTDCNDEYMVGSQLLVAPVTDQGSTVRSIYLPEGTWVDYWTGERIAGGQYILRKAPLDVCPIYVKGGSLLPTYPEMQSVSASDHTELIMEYYPDTLSDNTQTIEYMHYQDNGTDFAYENGEYNLYHFSVASEQQKVLNTELSHNGYSAAYSTISMHLC